jgi:ribose transport system ATP-binding protein
MVALMLGVGAYAATRSPDFLSDFNLNTLFGSSGALPLAIVAIAQMNVLMMGGFDVSVGALMTLTVVVASHGLLTTGASWPILLAGSLALLGIGVLVGLTNAFLIRKIGLPSIIATLATLSVLQGISLQLRPEPGGEVSYEVLDALNTSVDFMPFAFIGVVVLAVVADLWLYRTSGGLATRAVGLDENSARRIGIAAGRINWRAYVLASVLAVVAGFFLAAQVGIGDARVGASYALTSIAAAVLGGASLAGGKGSFIGAVVGALFLSLIINILPLPNILPGFLQEWSGGLGFIATGTLTLLALVIYQAPALWVRLRTAWGDLRHGRRTTPPVAG